MQVCNHGHLLAAGCLCALRLRLVAVVNEHHLARERVLRGGKGVRQHGLVLLVHQEDREPAGTTSQVVQPVAPWNAEPQPGPTSQRSTEGAAWRVHVHGILEGGAWISLLEPPRLKASMGL